MYSVSGGAGAGAGTGAGASAGAGPNNRDLLKQHGNTLEIVFDRSISTHGRFMACSGGWDWAPYSNLRSGEGHQMFTRGIWKSVYVDL